MIDATIQDMVRKIALLYRPERVLLFGSYAKGTQTPYSDIDLLIVKESRQPHHMRGREVRQLFYDSLTRVDLMFYTAEELEDELAEPHSFLSSVAETWIEVYAAPR